MKTNVLFPCLLLLFCSFLEASTEETAIFKTTSTAYTPAASASQALGLSIFFSPVSRVVVIKNENITGKFIVGQSDAIIDGELIEILETIRIYQDEVYIPLSIFIGFFQISDELLSSLPVKKLSELETKPAAVTKTEIIEKPAPEIQSTDSDTTLLTSEILSSAAETVSIESTAESFIAESTAESVSIQDTSVLEPVSDKPVISKPAVNRKFLFFMELSILEKNSSHHETLKTFAREFTEELSKSSELRVLSIKEFTPDFINRAGHDFLLVFTPSFHLDTEFRGISIYPGGDAFLMMPELNKAVYEVFPGNLASYAEYTGIVQTFPGILSFQKNIICPALTVELFNLNSVEDRNWLNDETLRKRFIKALTRALGELP